MGMDEVTKKNVAFKAVVELHSLKHFTRSIMLEGIRTAARKMGVTLSEEEVQDTAPLVEEALVKLGY